MLQDGDKGAVIQRDRKTYAIAPHLVCGLAEPATLRKIADVAEKYSLTIKVTSEQRVALIGALPGQVDAIWADLGMERGHVVGSTVRGVKACPGAEFCKRAQQSSLSVGRILDQRYHGIPLPGKMKFAVSGCAFQCAESNFRDIGLVGKPKGWAVYIGGNGGGRARIGQLFADNVSTETALEIVDRLVTMFKSKAQKGDRMGRIIDRIGMDAIREAIGMSAAGTLMAPASEATA